MNKPQQLAKIITNHSIKVLPGDKVLLAISDFSSMDLAIACYQEVLKKGGFIYLDVMGTLYEMNRADFGGFRKSYYQNANKEFLQLDPKIFEFLLNWADKYINIVTVHDKKFLNVVDPGMISTTNKLTQPIKETILNKNWLLTYYPTEQMAKAAGMTLDEFIDFYYAASIVDYSKMDKAIKPFQDILDEGKIVEISGQNVDLKLIIKDRLSLGVDSGIHNIPDGECYIAPNHTSVEGELTFEYPQFYLGSEFENLFLKFKHGKIVKFSCRTLLQEKNFSAIINESESNRYIGELGFGKNKNITTYIKDVLFDEKIYGTFHIALGRAYDQKRGGGTNKGTIHWDLIKDLRHQGSSIKIDEKVIFKNGKYTY